MKISSSAYPSAVRVNPVVEASEIDDRHWEDRSVAIGNEAVVRDALSDATEDRQVTEYMALAKAVKPKPIDTRLLSHLTRW